MTHPTDKELLSQLAIFGECFTPSRVQALNVATTYRQSQATKEPEIKRKPGGWLVRCTLIVAGSDPHMRH